MFNKASICSERCDKLLPDILLPATECKSADTQQTYFQYLEQIGKQITKFKNSANVIVSKNGKDNRQYNFSDK